MDDSSINVFVTIIPYPVPFSTPSNIDLIDSLVLPEGEEAEGNEMESMEVTVADATVEENATAEPEKPRKQRWKAAGKETAKKTKKLQEKKAAKTAKIAKSKKKK